MNQDHDQSSGKPDLLMHVKSLDLESFKIFFEQVHQKYMKKCDDSTIALYFFVCQEAVIRVRRRYTTYLARFNEDQVRDVIVQYLIRAKRNLVQIDPFSHFRNFLKDETVRNKFKINDDVDIYSSFISRLSIERSIVLEETITEILNKQTLKIRVAVLHRLKNRSSPVKPVYDELEDLLISMTMHEILAELNDHTLSISIMPETHTGRVLMLNYLRKKSPVSMVLLTLLKDPTKLYQFCRLFGGQTIVVPKFEELLGMVEDATDTLNNSASEEELKIFDHEMLSNIVNELDEISDQLVLDSYVGDYFNRIVSMTSKTYEVMLSNMEKRSEHARVDELLTFFSTLNREFKLQTNLMRQISSLVDVNSVKNDVIKG